MKTIIFALDNTLLFLSNDWDKYYLKTINKYNLNIIPKELYSYIGLFEKSHSNTIVSMKDIANYMNHELSFNISEAALNDLWNNYVNIPLLHTDKARNILSYLSKKYRIIGYSNQFRSVQLKRLRKYDLDKYFSEIYGWDIIPAKPSKTGIETIVNSENTKDFILIGDSIEVDLEMPDNMGIETILYNSKNIKQNNYKEIKDIMELKNIL